MADDTNITPDMINNLVNMLKNSSNAANNESNENSSNNLNFENLFSSNSNNTNSNNNSSAPNIDFDTILKIKSIMETLNNKNDPKSNLLYSLKPYLRKSKQDKLDQYVNILKLSQVTNIFKNSDQGDAK